MPIRYQIIGVLSIAIGIAIAKIGESYNPMIGDLLSSNTVFVFVEFGIFVILEGVYQAIYWLYKKK